MGYEYTLKVKSHSREKVDALLRRVPRFRSIDSELGGYTYRSAENVEEAKGDSSYMPDAWAKIEDYGVYVCVYGGVGDEVFKDIIGQMVSEYDTVEVSKLDWE